LGGCESLGSAFALQVELLLLLGDESDGRVARFSVLVERERLGGGALEGAGGAFRRRGRVRFPLRCVALEGVAIGEVEVGLEAGAGAGDVAPFLQGALVVEEDEGAVDGHALGGVAGERVAVVEARAG
jgi:hypothetical protein